MGNKVKKYILPFIVAILLLPLLQQSFAFITSAPLNGFMIVAPDVSFSLQKWWDGAYQSEKAAYLNDNTGFRPDLVRINNQLEYSLFGKINSQWIISGKSNCLYQDLYIYDYYGKDFMGYEPILNKMTMVRKIQDTLAKLGKTLILIHAPCKAFYYPEYIPGYLKITPRGNTNLETYVRIGDSLHVNQIDFNAWFISMKNDSKELLYPKQGFHWSVYGSLIAADSLVKYIEKRRNIRMPHLHWDNIVHTTKPRSKDNDIAQLLNLIYPTTTETFSYPEVYYTEDNTASKPKIMYIGDSFLFTWIDDGLMDHTNADWIAWANSGYSSNNNPQTEQQPPIAEYNWINGMRNMDCIVLLYTSRDLYRLGDGFIEKVYSYYYPTK